MTMTQIDGVPSRNSVKPGMAHFSGTGPNGATCGECALLALQKGSREMYRCAKFAQLTGKPGNCSRSSFGPANISSRRKRHNRCHRRRETEMPETLYQTELFGPVRIVGRDVTGRVLIETTERRDNRPEWPQTTQPGWREWVSQFAIGPVLTQHHRGSENV